jgi:hypothetical protein
MYVKVRTVDGKTNAVITISKFIYMYISSSNTPLLSST